MLPEGQRVAQPASLKAGAQAPISASTPAVLLGGQRVAQPASLKAGVQAPFSGPLLRTPSQQSGPPCCWAARRARAARRRRRRRRRAPRGHARRAPRAPRAQSARRVQTAGRPQLAHVCLESTHNSIQVQSTTAVEHKGLCGLPNISWMCERGCALSACRRHDSTSPRTRTCVPAMRSPTALPPSNSTRPPGEQAKRYLTSLAGNAHHISPASPSPHIDCQRSGLCRVRPPYVTASVWCPAVGEGNHVRASVCTSRPVLHSTITAACTATGGTWHAPDAMPRLCWSRSAGRAAACASVPGRSRLLAPACTQARAARDQLAMACGQTSGHARETQARGAGAALRQSSLSLYTPSQSLLNCILHTQEPAMPCLDRQTYPQACLLWVDRQGGGWGRHLTQRTALPTLHPSGTAMHAAQMLMGL